MPCISARQTHHRRVEFFPIIDEFIASAPRPKDKDAQFFRPLFMTVRSRRIKACVKHGKSPPDRYHGQNLTDLRISRNPHLRTNAQTEAPTSAAPQRKAAKQQDARPIAANAATGSPHLRRATNWRGVTRRDEHLRARHSAPARERAAQVT